MILCPNDLMSGLIFKIGVANQAIPKMQNHGGPQHRGQPVSGLHFSAHHFSACLGSCSVFLQGVLTSTFEGSRRTHAGCVRTQASVQSLQILTRFESRLGIRESGHSFKIGVANQANPKMQNHGGPQHRDQPVSGLHFSAHHFSACLGSCSMFLQGVLTSTFEGSRRTHAGCVRTQASVQSLQILIRFESRLGIRESGHIFKIGIANQANPKMQNHGGPQHRDQPVSGLHFSAHHFSACLGSCSMFLQGVLTSTFEGSRRTHAGCVRTQASVQSLQILIRL
jgi:hypothetical protein